MSHRRESNSIFVLLLASIPVLIPALALLLGASSAGWARPTFFTNTCSSCHSDDTPTCNACHEHRGSVTAVADHAEYGPGELVTITLDGGWEMGWIRGLLYDQNNAEVDRATGPTGTGDDGLGNPVTFPVTLQAPAPANPGQYTWQAAWYGSTNNSTTHGELRRPVTIKVVQDPADVGEEPEDPPQERILGWGLLKREYRQD